MRVLLKLKDLMVIYYLHFRRVVLKSLMPLIVDESLKCSEEELLEFVGLVAQSELGDFKQAMIPAFKEEYAQYLPESKLCEEMTLKVCMEHKKHKGMKSESAVYRALQKAVTWPGFGMEWHSVRKAQTAEPLTVGVGPQSVVVIDQQTGDERRWGIVDFSF